MTKKPNFNGTLGTYKWELTEDGSYTLYSEYFDENCHSTAGAVAETVYNYILGTQVPQFLKAQEKVAIFEVGFGTGLGLKSTLDYILDHFDKPQINFTSSELDRELTHHCLLELQQSGYIEEISWSEKDQLFHGSFNDRFHSNSKWLVLVGDIRKRIEYWRQTPFFEVVDCIYQDAFSPKRSPTLWTHQWFSQLAKIAKAETVMATYSSTKAVWKAMAQAGWAVEMVKGHGNKKISTRAYYDGRVMEQEILNLMQRSPTPALSD